PPSLACWTTRPRTAWRRWTAKRRLRVEVGGRSSLEGLMIRARSLAALVLSVALATGTSACAQSVGMQSVGMQGVGMRGGGDEVIRTARSEAPAPLAPPVVVPTTAETFDAVSNTLDAAAEAWSSGDVEAVMATYVQDEPLLVFLGDTPLKGPDSVRAAL